MWYRCPNAVPGERGLPGITGTPGGVCVATKVPREANCGAPDALPPPSEVITSGLVPSRVTSELVPELLTLLPGVVAFLSGAASPQAEQATALAANLAPQWEQNIE